MRYTLECYDAKLNEGPNLLDSLNKLVRISRRKNDSHVEVLSSCMFLMVNSLI